MKTWKFVAGIIIVGLLSGICSVWMYARMQGNRSISTIEGITEPKQADWLHYASYQEAGLNQIGYTDLTLAAEKAVHSVVHVKVKGSRVGYSSSGNPFFDFFYGYKEERIPTEKYGSGVIISEDGYIVTNNHVIDEAEELEVVFNDNHTAAAQLIGTDAVTDIALLKVEETGLPYLTFGDSEALRIGEWVLAVGNPYNLTSTVTAGIVSAKARRIEEGGRNMRIESFIQTDAAVNPGNSGGALVNANGDLVGINTAIISKTGSYSGNSFAIPVTIVSKIVDDLKQHGVVQRAVLGIVMSELNEALRKERKVTETEGVYIGEVIKKGSADAAGLKEGDIIKGINGYKIAQISDLYEQLAKYRPNDKIRITYLRDGSLHETEALLQNVDGNTEIITQEKTVLGAKLATLSKDDRKKLGLDNGVRVESLEAGKLKSIGIREGFIITAINDKAVNSAEEIEKIINSVEKSGRVLITGKYPQGQIAYYVFAK